MTEAAVGTRQFLMISTIPVRQAPLSAASGGFFGVSQPAAPGSRLWHRHRPRSVCQGRCARYRDRPCADGDRPCEGELCLHDVEAEELRVGNGEDLPYADATFDVVYGHGVVQYTSDPARLIRECHRVLKPGGDRHLHGLQPRLVAERVVEGDESAARARGRAGAEEVFHRRVSALLHRSAKVDIIPERFPVKSRLHKGWKGVAFNTMFVGTFNALPRSWVRPLGWHLMAFCRKA